MPPQPRARGPAEPAPLLGIDHLLRVTEAVPELRLDLTEDKPASAPNDEVELVTADPGIALEHPVAANAIPPQCAPLGALAAVHDGKLRRANARVCYGLRTELRTRKLC